MRHGKKNNHLGRKAGHRRALLSNMAKSLIVNKRITTTVAKAKALRKYIEPLITKAKTDTTHSRRVVFSYLQDKGSVAALFGEVASRTNERPGGYTRIIKLGETRVGDNAEVCMMELVDFNEVYTKEGAAKKAHTRRSRGKGKKEEGEETTVEATAASEKPAEPAKEKSGKVASDKKE